jgi:hypothetical protein
MKSAVMGASTRPSSIDDPECKSVRESNEHACAHRTAAELSTEQATLQGHTSTLIPAMAARQSYSKNLYCTWEHQAGHLCSYLGEAR